MSITTLSPLGIRNIFAVQDIYKTNKSCSPFFDFTPAAMGKTSLKVGESSVLQQRDN